MFEAKERYVFAHQRVPAAFDGLRDHIGVAQHTATISDACVEVLHVQSHL